MYETTGRGHELRFLCLTRGHPAFSFPCDASGRVELDHLSDRVRNDYLYARAMVGRDLAAPRVEPASSP